MGQTLHALLCASHVMGPTVILTTHVRMLRLGEAKEYAQDHRHHMAEPGWKLRLQIKHGFFPFPGLGGGAEAMNQRTIPSQVSWTQGKKGSHVCICFSLGVLATSQSKGLKIVLPTNSGKRVESTF